MVLGNFYTLGIFKVTEIHNIQNEPFMMNTNPYTYKYVQVFQRKKEIAEPKDLHKNMQYKKIQHLNYKQ